MEIVNIILSLYCVICYGAFLAIIHSASAWNEIDFLLVLSFLAAPISLPITAAIYYIIK